MIIKRKINDTVSLRKCKLWIECYNELKRPSSICLSVRDIVSYQKEPYCFVPVHVKVEQKLKRILNEND